MPSNSVDAEAIWSRLDDEQPIHPISAQNIDRLLRRARIKPGGRVLDVGCGSGVWGQHVLRMYPDVHYLGLDLGETLIERAREIAKRNGTDDRTRFEVADVVRYPLQEKFDLVLLNGLPELWGDVGEELNTFRRHLTKSGCLIYGTGVWERPPPPESLAAMGETEESAIGYHALVSSIITAGWVPIHGHKSSTAEMDLYLWACIDALARWGFDGDGDNPATVANPHAMAHLHTYLGSWLHHYREYMSMATFVLRPLPSIFQSACLPFYRSGHSPTQSPLADDPET